VGLELLPRAAAVALLAAPQIVVDLVAVEREAGGEAGRDRHERRPVRFAGGDEGEAHAPEPSRTAPRITSRGAAIPVQRSKEAAPWRTSTSKPSTTVAQPAARAAATSAVGLPSAL